MKITVVIASHGSDWWKHLARSRAYPSALASGADEVLIDHHPEATRAKVRNGLTYLAEGDYIVTLDADDELSPGYCDHIRENDPWDALVVPRVQYVRGYREGAPHFLPRRNIKEDNWMVVGTAFPKDRFLEVGGWRTLTGTGVMNEADDWDLWARMTNAGCGITYCEEAVYRAFIDRKSAHRSSGRSQRQKWMEEIRALNWPTTEGETMPVTYTDQSEGPSTRRANGEEPAESRPTVAVTSSSQMSKAALQRLAEERGLPTSGSKADLIDRLSR